ncbi:hypothetical protein CYMTET_26024, partial [Cymbomonas tetramitiformis]
MDAHSPDPVKKTLRFSRCTKEGTGFVDPLCAVSWPHLELAEVMLYEIVRQQVIECMHRGHLLAKVWDHTGNICFNLLQHAEFATARAKRLDADFAEFKKRCTHIVARGDRMEHLEEQNDLLREQVDDLSVKYERELRDHRGTTAECTALQATLKVVQDERGEMIRVMRKMETTIADLEYQVGENSPLRRRTRMEVAAKYEHQIEEVTTQNEELQTK